GTTPVVWTRTVNMWFDRSRGLALGLTLAGAGAAGIFGPLFCTALIETYGWQAGYLGVGALILLVSLPVIALLFKERPVEVGLDAGKQGAAMPEREGLTFQQSIRTVWFWKIVIAFFLVSGAIAGLIINVVPLLM